MDTRCTPMLVIKGHRKRVRCLAFSPDGTLLASAAGKGHAVSLWDARSGKRLRFLSWHDSTLAGLAFSPDGELLASTDSGGSYQFWDIPSGKGRFAPVLSPDRANQITFAPDRRTYLTASRDWPRYRVVRRDLDTTEAVETLWGGSSSDVACMALSPGGEALAVGAGDDVHVWDLGARALRMTLPHPSPVRAVAYSPDGRSLAVAALRKVRLHDPITGTPRVTLTGHERLITAVAYTNDSRILLTSSNDQTVRVWDASSGRQLAAYDWQIGRVHAVAVASDGMRAAAGGDALIVLWDLDDLPT
jgi:WD40 repeat protein